MFVVYNLIKFNVKLMKSGGGAGILAHFLDYSDNDGVWFVNRCCNSNWKVFQCPFLFIKLFYIRSSLFLRNIGNKYFSSSPMCIESNTFEKSTNTIFASIFFKYSCDELRKQRSCGSISQRHYRLSPKNIRNFRLGITENQGSINISS